MFQAVRLKISLYFVLLSISFAASASSWADDWLHFKQSSIFHGRVIDLSSKKHITTSEGQSYAMFFALVANDQTTFDALLAWTEINLANQDFQTQSISWLWGQIDSKQWGVLDKNTAVDATLWIAYDLLEAGRLWGEKHYIQKAHQILSALRKDVVDVSGLGQVLLPGKSGFFKPFGVVMNPSYYPPQLMQRLAKEGSVGHKLSRSLSQILTSSAPYGYAPDWIAWDDKKSDWRKLPQNKSMGSYDAIRVYLWIGMLPNSREKTQLMRHFMPYLDKVIDKGYVPERVDWKSGQFYGQGPIGFYAALLPVLSVHAKSLFYKKVMAYSLRPEHYYDSVLILFSKGWVQQYFSFDEQGYLLPKWTQLHEK